MEMISAAYAHAHHNELDRGAALAVVRSRSILALRSRYRQVSVLQHNAHVFALELTEHLETVRFRVCTDQRIGRFGPTDEAQHVNRTGGHHWRAGFAATPRQEIHHSGG